jgi:hypothetical protein
MQTFYSTNGLYPGFERLSIVAQDRSEATLEKLMDAVILA